MRLFLVSAVVALMSLAAAPAAVGADFPTPVDGDFVARDFQFGSGETLAALNQ